MRKVDIVGIMVAVKEATGHLRLTRTMTGVGLARCAGVLPLILGLLLTGTFGGLSILSHNHHGHGAHWHVALSCQLAIAAGARHRADHDAGLSDAGEHRHEHCRGGHGHDHGRPGDDGAPPASDQPEDGTLIAVPDHDPAVTRGGPAALEAAVAWVPFAIAWVVAPDPGAVEQKVDPGGAFSATPRHLCALDAGDRLVRTSRALLL